MGPFASAGDGRGWGDLQQKAVGETNWHLNRDFRCGVLPSMAEEKSRSKDIILWVITVLLIALAIFWYKR